jgi:hypothetical protein
VPYSSKEQKVPGEEQKVPGTYCTYCVLFAGNLSWRFRRFGAKTDLLEYRAACFSEKFFQHLEPATQINFQG